VIIKLNNYTEKVTEIVVWEEIDQPKTPEEISVSWNKAPEGF
jgi:hypothetical protein